MGATPAFVIHPDIRTMPLPRGPEAMLEEAVRLVAAISLDVVHAEAVSLHKPRAPTFLGTGFVDRIADIAAEHDEPVIVVNAALTPVQQRNLETRTKCKVIDRTALILEIFGARAQTHAGRLQVELAALTFQRSRLVRSWTHLERQIELDRRMLMDRVVRIRKELKEVERTRHLQRGNRQRGEVPTIALIGYTNAGKSTLFNRLTGAGVLSKDMLFATLDPTMRAITLASGREVVLADTVGFISQLPTELVEAFKSTLEEVVQADLLLHVHDAASPLVAEEAGDVRDVLAELGLDEEAQDARLLSVLNKADLLVDRNAEGDTAQDDILQNLVPDAVRVSALTGAGMDDLLAAIEARIGAGRHVAEVVVGPADGAARAWLFARGDVRHSETSDTGDVRLQVAMETANWARFHARWPGLAE